MKNTLRAFCFLSVTLLFNSISAQQNAWCGSDRLLQKQITANPQKWADYIQQVQSPLSQSSRAIGTTVYVPVVFHIIHNGDALGSGENITDAQAISQIDALNRYYNFQDPDLTNVPAAFQSLIADCNVRFCLAQFDENGLPTTGVTHDLFANNATWDDETTIDNTLKPATIWDPTRYLNIWSVRMGGQLATDGVLAYSSFPGFGAADADGIVSRYTNIGTTSSVPTAYRKGKTITHEIGHWLGLIHIWGFDASCGGFGDLIDDTPDQADLNFGCPTFPHITCNNGPNGDMFMNYMDYTNEGCQGMFTIGQATRMHETLDGTRASIKNSASGCYYNLDAAVVKVVLPADTVCSLSFKPVVSIKNEGTTTINSGKFYFQIDGNGVQIVNWSGSIEMQQQIQVTLPEQTVVAGSHTFDVTFGNVNGQSSDGNSINDNKNNTFIAYDGGAGASPNFFEDFEVSYPPFNWTNYNPNSDNTWTSNNNYGGYGTSYNSVYINNLNYSSNPGPRRDAFVTDVYNLSAIALPQINFDVAYARNNPNRSDSLNIYYSLDCGSNWIKTSNYSGEQLATAPDQTTLFQPDPSQWKTLSVPLTSILTQGKVSFKFENVTDWGNALYIDNINITNNPALSVTEVQKQDIKVFPNPAANLVGVRLPAYHSFNKVQLINNMGEIVYQTAVSDNAIIFSVQNFANGLYLIHFEGNTVSQTEKLLISK